MILEVVAWLGGLLAVAVGATLTTGVQAWLGKAINKLKQARALARVRAEPLYTPGTRIVAAYRDGVAEPLVEGYRIEEVSLGRIVLRGPQGEALPMTNAEFEALHVVVKC